MDKLKLAHDWAMQSIDTGYVCETETLVSEAWKYANAMQAEAEKRNKAEAEKKRKEVREILNDASTFIEREGQHFDDVEEWQPDWSQAPDDAIGWMIFDGASTWLGESGYLIEEAPSFGFTGTHIMERPNGF